MCIRDRDYADRATQKRETDFIDVVAWRHTATFVHKHFAKGRMAVVSGRLQMRDWTDKDGGKRRNAEVVADNVYFGDSKREESDSREPENPPPVTPTDFTEMADDDGELPF